MVEKRPHAGDEVSSPDAKRPRSNNASPAPLANGATGKNMDLQRKIAEAKARADALKSKMGQRPSVAGPRPPSSPAPPAAQTPAEAARARVEALKARVSASSANSASTPPGRISSPAQTWQPPQYEDTSTRLKGGLGVGVHPALLGDSGHDAKSKGTQSMAPKFSTTMGNRRTESPLPTGKGKQKKQELDLSGPNIEELRKNPYYDPSLGRQANAKPRQTRNLLFNQKGKYIAQANALRRQAQLEDMKKKIAEQARKAGLDEDNEKAFLVPKPPDVEWWDEGLIKGQSYDALDDPNNIKLEGDDSIITLYVQHPVLIDPPQDKNVPAPKPMYLTAKEQAKLRRQRRNALHKEEQAKIRLGLVEPPPPKVKKSNLMRVLGEQAVKDPTAVEARVNREIAERKVGHETANEERKLTKEQRHEKLAENQEKDASKGIRCCVFKIENLSFGKHRYQIDNNAKQYALTGMTILHPRMNLVIVEGGEWALKKYKHLMLDRIRWEENGGTASVNEARNNPSGPDWLKSEDDNGQLKDLSFNKCTLVWEGEERQRAFKRWSSKVCETDGEAKEVLQRNKMENMWTLAKSITW
ncbi:MAG: hypothetical protein M1821_009575 [Bathelium mastoideum]|nr:MAG: hypothetical protein M1821_009575 [Bathelium mastoideum]